METVYSNKISKLEEKAKMLDTKKRLLKEKEKQKIAKLKSKRHTVIGKLADRAEVSELDQNILLGAFLEIKEQASSKEQIKTWKEKASSLQKKELESGDTAFSISFDESFGTEEKKIMQSLKFRYNKFRNEFYGYGKESDIKFALEKYVCKIEPLEK